MDDELRNAFATLSAQMSDVGSDARKAAEMSRETAHEMVKLSRKVDGLEADVGQLKVAVFGSSPPPSPSPPVTKRVSQAEGDLAELSGQIIAVKAINEDQNKTLDELKTAMSAHRADTFEIKREIVDGVKSFWKRNPKLESALVLVIGAALGLAYQVLTHGGHP
jgi:ElaB/YqjD/DUF883 family membrane-anchored ribosome-binding protein